MKFKTLPLKMVVAASFSLIYGLQAQAGFDFLESAQLTQTIKNQIAKQTIGTNVNLVGGEVFDGISMALKYRIQSEPSYVSGYYTRLDKYTLGVDVNPGDLLEGQNLPLGFGMSKNAEIVFARQFKSQAESLTALPYNIRHIPLSARIARENLNVGDFVSLQSKLSFVVSLGAGSPVLPYLSVSGSTHAFISGDFYIHLFKVAENKMRVKLIGIRGRGDGAGAEISFGPNFKIIGFNYVDNKIKKFLDLTPLAINLSRNKSDVFMIDYIFNLDDSKAAMAYEDLLVKKARFKDMALVNPLQSAGDLGRELLTDLSDVEAISYADRDLQPTQRRIDRIFKGSNSADAVSTSFRFGLNILRIENGTTFAENKVVHVDRQEVEKKYLLNTYSVLNKKKFLFGLFGEDSIISTNLLFQSDNAWQPNQFVALSLSREIKMKEVSARDYKKIQKHVARIVPSEVYNQIDWKNWDFSKGDLVNGYFKNQIFFHPEALNYLPTMSAASAYKAFKSYIAKHDEPAGNPRQQSFPYDEYNTHRKWLERYDLDIQYIGAHLAVIFNPAYSPSDRLEKFIQLKEYSLWQERGVGFLISMLPVNLVKDLITYELVFSAKGAEPISAKLGNLKERELYDSLMFIQGVINNRSFDLRLYTDQSGEVTLK